MRPASHTIPRPLQVRTRIDGATAVVQLIGELDAGTTALVLRAARNCLRRQATTVLIDLAALEFCDCTGLGALLRIRGEAALAGAEAICTGPLQPLPAKVFALTGVALPVAPGPPQTRAARSSRFGP